MKNINRIISVAFLIIALVAVESLSAAKSKTVSPSKSSGAKADAICLPPSNDGEITINNVRAYIQTDGTMWSTEVAQYEIPKGSGKTSMFCAALWIGGTDRNNQLRLAAMRFGQVGNDYWTGPLDTRTAMVDQATCIKYDKLFKITRAEVVAHKEAFATNDETYQIPQSIRDWPGNGDWETKGQSFYLAPYFDYDGDGTYTPEGGDYPYYDLTNELCPWTEANLQRAAAHQLPVPPEELDARIPHAAGAYWQGGHMVYADHVLKGDETLFWIFNDMGGAHTETGGANIGLEIRGQVFGFATNDEINNMTFYSYEIINRSTRDLVNTYFSQWVDPDLGYADDDFVGCDVARGLGYNYNGRNVDGSGQLWAYGDQPPAVGVDFFQGPYIDPDGRDNPKFYKDSANNADYCTRFLNDPVDQMGINGVNFGDSIVDNERFGMRRFVYHNNDNSVTGDPTIAVDYYNYLRGIWRDNSRMRYGGNGHKDNGGIGPECDFMFPGTTDPCNWGTRGEPIPSQYQNSVGWTEEAEGNAPADRRFMQSAGPFTLNAGAVNYITVGIPWARASQGGAWASVELLKRADDACQALFENCFKVLDGPDAPDVTIRELENEIVIYLTNDVPAPIRNNFNETYQEVDPTIPSELVITQMVMDTIVVPRIDTTANPMLTGYDTIFSTRQETRTVQLSEEERTYKFEGYLIYQLANKDVSVTDLGNASKAQLIRQCDIKNQYAQLINWEYDERLATSVPVEKVNGSNVGISHSFSITEDKFATGSTKLVNHKTYYYMVLAYAVNEYRQFSIDPDFEDGLQGQKKVFLAGRNNIQVYSAIPHKPAPQENGTILNAAYGTQPMITRIEGQGNGGFALDLTDETRDKILAGGDKNQWGGNTWKIQELTYKNNAGPLAIKVIDPIKVQPFDYRLKFIDSVAVATNSDVSDKATWVLEVLDVTLQQAESMGYQNYWDNGTITLPSSMSISMHNEQLFLPLGISITIENRPFQIYQDQVLSEIAANPTSYANMSKYGQVDFISSSISYKDSTHQWLSGLVDMSGDIPANWIRSGSYGNGMWEQNSVQDGACDEYFKWRTEDAHLPMSYHKTSDMTDLIRAWKDPKGQFGKVVGGTWSPYVLASPFFGGPQARYIVPDGAFTEIQAATEPINSYYSIHYATGASMLGVTSQCPGFNQTMTNLYSVDIVMTNNKDLWTRCIVLEACDDATKSVGHAKTHEPRKQASVGKDGKPDGTGDGMGWFPGYAINVETGERLNIMFAENSADPENNGNDMLFNPTSVYGYYNADPGTGSENDTAYAISVETYNELYAQGQRAPKLTLANGGKHYLYICGSSGNTASSFYRTSGSTKRNYNDNDIQRTGTSSTTYGGFLNGDGETPYYECGPYDEGQWLMTKFNTFVSTATVPSQQQKNSKMQLFNNVMWTSIPMATPKETWVLDDKNNNDVTIKIRVSRPYMRYASRWYENYLEDPYSTQNYGLPLYSFTTKNIAPTTNNADLVQSILDEINIVPNPYYGFSQYENSSLEMAVKIVNLPEICDISIYAVSGILVNRISKGDKGTTSVTWDLKNSAGIPISSGMYIIHVKAPNIGERTLKFFAAMRPTDINSF